MKKEAEIQNLQFQEHINNVQLNPLAEQHNEYRRIFKILGKLSRKISPETPIHISVKERFEKNQDYRPKNLVEFVNKYGWNNLEH